MLHCFVSGVGISMPTCVRDPSSSAALLSSFKVVRAACAEGLVQHRNSLAHAAIRRAVGVSGDGVILT